MLGVEGPLHPRCNPFDPERDEKEAVVEQCAEARPVAITITSRTSPHRYEYERPVRTQSWDCADVLDGPHLLAERRELLQEEDDDEDPKKDIDLPAFKHDVTEG